MRISEDSPLVLGSASPRRQALLAGVGVPVLVRAAAADEGALPGEAPDAYLERITRAKLAAVRALAAVATGNVAPILVADTIVVAPRGAILGKPRDRSEAEATVAELAGATHEVRTRFVLGTSERSTATAHAETVTTRVTFRPLAPGEAQAYAATGEGLDKAGAYAVQGGASAFVARIDGSYTGVVGLPVCEVVVALRKLGWW